MGEENKINPMTGNLDKVNTGVSVPVYSEAPANPVEGMEYINSSNNTMYVYYAGTWQVIMTLTEEEIETGNPIGLLLALTYTTE